MLTLSKELFLSTAKKYKTPFYLYDLSYILSRYQELDVAFAGRGKIFYAVKANSNFKILQALCKAGAGVDVVSAGELELALQAGFSPQKIIFSGVAKSVEEILLALDKKIFQINVESIPELERIARLAKKRGVKAPIAFRMNPDVNPDTHPYITTGFRENKFGIMMSESHQLINLVKKNQDCLLLQGLSLHIGSQLLDLTALDEAIQKTIPFFLELKSLGHPMKYFDVGGGLGVAYQPEEKSVSLQEYVNHICKWVSLSGVEILVEPGRSLVAEAGVLVSQVEYIKTTEFKNFVILNTGMHHLLRPALYQAYHPVSVIKNGPAKGSNDILKTQTYDLVGPICESADVIARERKLPELSEGDYVLIENTGAYGFVMASHYNSHELPKEIIFLNGKEV